MPKRTSYFVMMFMPKRNFYFETEGVFFSVHINYLLPLFQNKTVFLF
jgi:hypothetical protein